MPDLSPAGWLDLLVARLDERWFKRLAAYDAYYEGDHRLSFATAKFREAFGSLFGTLADNWCPLVVDSSVERLKVQGFRAADQQEVDDEAWAIWQANGLDAQSDMLHTEAVKLGEAYWLVEPPKDGTDDKPRITAEHPSQMIVASAPGNRRVRLAALKKWCEGGYAYATLYLPNQIVKYQSEKELSKGGITGGRVNWVRRRDVESQISNPLGEVPVVPVCNSPSLVRGGVSDLQPIIPMQNAINKLLCDMLIGSEYQAFPQRVLLGADVPKDANGQPIRAAELKASQSRLWVFANENAKVSEFNAADLDNYVKAMEHLVRHLTAHARIPPPYTTGEIVNASGDALQMAQVGLVSKVRRKMVPFGESHEDTMRLAFKSQGKDWPSDAETIWADPENRSQGELVDSLVKLGSIGVPQEVLWERAGFSPQEIDRMRGMQEADNLLAALNAPQPQQMPMNGNQNAGQQPVAPTN